jgi:hypothetical protein
MRDSFKERLFGLFSHSGHGCLAIGNGVPVHSRSLTLHVQAPWRV